MHLPPKRHRLDHRRFPLSFDPLRQNLGSVPSLLRNPLSRHLNLPTNLPPRFLPLIRPWYPLLFDHQGLTIPSDPRRRGPRVILP